MSRLLPPEKVCCTPRMFGVKNNIRSHNVGSPSDIAQDCALYGNLREQTK